jgi:site-specific DNA recombinase
VQCCIYLRKSRADAEAEARGEGETLSRHERTLREVAAKMNIHIPEEAIYREIVSGESIAARPEMQRLLSDIERGCWQGVFVMEIERLARGDTIDQGIVAQAFKYSDTKIITPAKIYDPSDEFDEEYFEFGLFMSRREYKTINRRLQRGRLRSVKDGKYVGNIAPYGYKRKKLEHDSGFTLEPDPDEAPIVQMIYAWFTEERLGVGYIRRRLNKMKAPTRKGGSWTDATLRGILANPVYIGKIRWHARPQVKQMLDGEMVISRPRAQEPVIEEGLHKPLIAEDVFVLVQKIFADNATPPTPVRRQLQNPLAGILRCGICGRVMIRRPYEDIPAMMFCIGPGCPNVGSYLHLIEERVIQGLAEWLEAYYIRSTEQKAADYNQEAEMIRKSIEASNDKIATLETQVSNLHDLLEQGVYSIEVFTQRKALLAERLEKANGEKEELKKLLEQAAMHTGEQEEFVPGVEKLIDVYPRLKSVKQKNLLLKEVLAKAVYKKERSDRGTPDAFELVIYPKLPYV